MAKKLRQLRRTVVRGISDPESFIQVNVPRDHNLYRIHTDDRRKEIDSGG